MARNTGDPAAVGLALFVLIILYVIYVVVMWIINNWLIVLAVITVIGVIYFAYQYDKKNQEKMIEAKRQIDEQKLWAEERRRRRLLHEEQRKKALELQVFEDEQRMNGLLKFTNRFGKISWGTPTEVEEWKNMDDIEKAQETLEYRISAAIKKFRPSRKWAYEDGYHKELLGYLQHDFPNIKYEFQQGSSRPDLVIGNVAIEIKGPTDNAALDTLTTKCLKYSNYYDHLVMVLFDPQYSERNFREIKEGIEKFFPHVEIIRK
jgi:hypothetical protein